MVESLQMSAPDEDLLEHVGAVGDQPVDPEVEQVLHLRRLVDGPDVDMPTGCMRSAYERAV